MRRPCDDLVSHYNPAAKRKAVNQRMTSVTQPRVCISLLNWKHVETTLNCLETLQTLTYSPYEIVVVDNASEDNSVARLRAVHPELTILESGSNLGYAGGNALSCEYARSIGADLLWILNPDAFPEPGALSTLVAAYQQFGPGLYGSVSFEDRAGRRWFSQKHWGFNDSGEPDPAYLQVLSGWIDELFPELKPHRMGTLSGSSLLIPMALIEQYGFIDTKFFLYSEESDYSARLYRHGIPSYLIPASQVRHESTQGAHKHHSDLKGVILYYQVRNRLVVTKRYSRPLLYLRTLILHLFYIVAAYILVPLRGWQSAQHGLWMWRAWRDAVKGRMGRVYRPEDHLA